ncbi:protein-tyrosine phosphatase family protein [Endozoicomonadaceae bacterium StTr2]
MKSSTIYTITGLCNDRFSIMPHPRGGELLSSEISRLKQLGFEAVISMLTPEEQQALNLLDEAACCEAAGLVYLNFPIRDEVADSDLATCRFIDQLEQLQQHKHKIVFHCRGGVGRSSMILSLLAARLGVKPEQSFELISHSRGERAPESENQKQWVIKLAAKNEEVAEHE